MLAKSNYKESINLNTGTETVTDLDSEKMEVEEKYRRIEQIPNCSAVDLGYSLSIVFETIYRL